MRQSAIHGETLAGLHGLRPLAADDEEAAIQDIEARLPPDFHYIKVLLKKISFDRSWRWPQRYVRRPRFGFSWRVACS
jgi:hypothetical protein